MKTLKHSKFKNTAIIFDVLTRQLVAEAMGGNSNKALSIIKMYFKPDSALSKELRLYRGLVAESFDSDMESTHSINYVNTIVEARKKLSEAELKDSKFNLIRSIKHVYGSAFLENGFSARIPKYREVASAYKLFEYAISDNPKELMSCKMSLVESMQSEVNVSENPWSELSPSVRQLGFKSLLERFNEKYEHLMVEQKSILKAYINSPDTFNHFFKSEVENIRKQINHLSTKVPEVTKIKLTEISNMLDFEIKEADIVPDNQISIALKCYNLIDELKAYG